jgi:phage-related protein
VEFDWAESRSTRRNVMPRRAETRFGDGYRQRLPDGLNPIEETWDIVLDAVDDAIGDEISAFLEARGSWEAFTWRPKWRAGAPIRVLCTSWSRAIVDLGVSSFSLTFERVFEP